MAVTLKDTNVSRESKPTSNSFVSGPQFGLTTSLSSYGSGGDAYEKLYNKIKDILKSSAEDKKTSNTFSVIKLLKHAPGLNYSAIIVAETSNGFTAAHILMIERTGDYPQTANETIAGVRYELIRTPADALDDKYVTAAQAAVASTLNVDMSAVVITDGTLVPNEFDVNNEAAVMGLLSNTTNSTCAELGIRVSDYKGVNLGALPDEYRNGKFYINLYFNPEDSNFFDQTGMPVRQDICISLTYKTGNTQNNRSVNQGNDVTEIVKTYGYIDFEWSPSVVNNMMSSQKFVPNFIITHIESTITPTPDILMLGIASVLAINEDMNWMQSFRPTPSRKNEIDYNDIGALNIEGNIENSPTGFGKKYDTKSKTFSTTELNKFIQTLVRPNIMVSIDLPKAGPETWFTSVLQYVRFRNSKEALARVNEYITTLTNGNYQPAQAPMFADVTNKIHGGFYRSKDGFKDIRHLNSYLSITNFINDTNQSPALAAQYTNTLYNTAIPAELRSAERKKYIDEMSNKTAVYKQYHDRVTFSAPFLSSLITSLKMVGFAPVFSNMGATNDMFQRRSTSDFSSAMLGMDARIMGQSNMYGNYFGIPYGYTRTF